ncbi:methionine--tRNA ligase [Candidatus Dependentiae bacterium]|nr:methionine--tRNA ligase [Candidatus Dependentiae bacterium]
MNKNKFYVTTPIYYVNAKPHLGTLYSTLLADVTARWNKLQGKKVFFLTGTDEHGQKVAERAAELGVTPQAMADSQVPHFQEAWKKYELEYDKFIRTTDGYHKKNVIEWIEKLQDQGDIYKSHYSGWYCVPDERFVTIASEEVEKDESGNYLCPQCGRLLTEMSEESYFFRLSAYQDQLVKFYEEHPNFITPKERANEVISFVKSGLEDLSISRKTVSWGIPFPGDPKHTVYVWGDALNNYVSAIKGERDFWWPADLHIIGKDIIRFHAVYWPAFLMASGLELPKKLLVHGYILVDEQKMSKSIGNVVDPVKLADWYGVEQVRYYLVRQMSVNQDGNFSLKDLEGKISSDLANNLGNLLNRTITLALNNGLETVSPVEIMEADGVVLHEKCEEAFRSYWDGMNHYRYHLALTDLFKFVSEVNVYFHAQKPWVVAKENKELFEEIISSVCHSLYSVAIMLWPVMPKKMEELLRCIGHELELGANYDEVLRKNLWNKTFVLKKSKESLFPKPESRLEKIEEKPAEKEIGPEEIAINDFAKVELLVGTIVSCDPVEGSDKLYKLSVDLGKRGIRTIFAGVAKLLKPEELLKKQGIFVGNLKPRKMMGDVSHGMMLFAKDGDGNFQMTTVAGPVDNGARLG